MSLALASTITCPHCGAESRETMPDDACVVVFDCPACAGHLRPRPGDCCIFCSFGTVPCPPMQEPRSCGTA
ncbi:MAG TPA: GDCCVxC domain-containing (seleno)protein [Acetobacteraceae bacterium]|nr:GDCCVxC domain-containing (seleno)protein [Acetobacteraceae bacterium]